MIKQNKNTSAIWGRIASGLAACFLLFSLVAVPPVFADSSDWTLLPQTNLYSDGFYIGSWGGVPARGGSSSPDTYYAYISGSPYPSVIVICPSSFTFYQMYSSHVDSASGNSSSSDYPGFVYLFGSAGNGPSSLNSSIHTFSSLDDALSSAYSFIGDGASSSGSAFLVPTSYTSISSTSYIKALKPDVSGYAYYFDGTYYNLVVGNINANNIVTIASDTSQHPVNTLSMLTFDDDPIYYTANAMRVSESDVPEGSFFTNLNYAVEAIYNVVSATGSVPSQNIANSLNLSLNPGNVAFIDISGLSSLSGSIHVSLNGMAYYTLSDFNSKMNYMIGYASELPESFSLPIPNTSKIIWTTERGVDKPTATGTYNSFSYFFDYNFSLGKYLVIVNPVYESLPVDSATVLDINAYNTNNVLNISCEANSYYIYSLSVSVGYEDGQSTYESGSTTSQYVGEYDPNTDTWSSTNVTTGEPGTPSYGGDVVTPTLSVGEQSKRFINWLQDFLKNFVDIFDVGKSAIMTLVGYGSSFFSAISGLYAWLPSSVYSVLTSSLVLVFVIGVIKVFL